MSTQPGVRRIASARLLLAVTAAGAACGAPNDAPGPAGPFTTDAAAYVAHRTAQPRGPHGYRYGFTVVARYANPRARPVRLDYCRSEGRGAWRPKYHVTRLDVPAGEEGAAYARMWACAGPAPGADDRLVVAPGATRLDTLLLEGPNMWEGREGYPVGVLAGRFRLEYDAEAAPDDPAGPLPDSLRRSNAFTVRLSRRPW